MSSSRDLVAAGNTASFCLLQTEQKLAGLEVVERRSAPPPAPVHSLAQLHAAGGKSVTLSGLILRSLPSPHLLFLGLDVPRLTQPRGGQQGTLAEQAWVTASGSSSV